MSFSDLTDNAWAIFLVVGFVLLFVGYRMGRVKTAAGATYELGKVNWPLVWSGVVVLTAGAVFGVVLFIVRGSVFGVLASLFQVAVYIYVALTVGRTQRRVRTAGAGE